MSAEVRMTLYQRCDHVDCDEIFEVKYDEFN